MTAESSYHAHGVRFRFPKDWTLSEERADQHVAVTVDGPQTSFWSVNLFFDCPSPEHVLQTAVELYRAEYEDLDVYPSRDQFRDRPTFANDIEFLCLEMVNSVFLRAFQTDRFTVLVLIQGTDTELSETRAVLDRISDSLEWDCEADSDADLRLGDVEE